jgi:hypothetical protein
MSPSMKGNSEVYLFYVVLLIHIDNYEKFNRIDLKLLESLHRGDLQNDIYAIAKDRSRVHSGLTPYYYEFTENYDCRSEVNFDRAIEKDLLNLINNRRNKIGLKNLE